MQELFVYYRIRAGDEEAALGIVTEFQAALKQRFAHLEARLLRRSDPLQQTSETWMETYAVDPAAGTSGVDANLQCAIEAAAQLLAPHIDGVRHAELFVASAQASRCL
jgi:hypothetical protein